MLRIPREIILSFCTAAVALFACQIVSGQATVLTFHNDNARSGQVTAESVLTPAAVNFSHFGKLMNIMVDGKVDAQPLYVSGLNMPGQGVADVLFAATEHGSVYAFDANSGAIFWQISTLASGETSSDPRSCGQVQPEIGISATPVIDKTAGPHGTIYVVAMSKDGNGNYHQRLHALDITSGVEEFSGPIAVAATYPGTGANSSNGVVVFDPKQYKSRAALLLANGVVYTSWGSHCDHNPYTGWVIGYTRGLKQVTVFNLAPNGNEAALWNSGAGPAADAQGNLFVSVANGTFDTTLDAQGMPVNGDYGNSFLKLGLRNGATVATDYWTMYNTTLESGRDVDLGSGGIMLLPDLADNNGTIHHLAVGGGKDSNLYVVDRDNMGKYNPNSDSTIYQQLSGALSGGIFSSPAYFNNHVYFGPIGSGLQAFEISNAKLAFSSSTTHSFGYPGATPSVSSFQQGGGIVWAAENTNPAVLHAYDAGNLNTELYNSSMAASSRDAFGAGNKYIVPTVANGQVFVGSTNSIGVFGLLPSLPLANGVYIMTNRLSSLVLDDPGASRSPGLPILQYSYNGGANEKWSITANGSGYYTIRNLAGGLYLTDPNGSAMAGTTLQQFGADGSDAQLWSFTISGSGYVITNKASGLVINNAGSSMKQGASTDLQPASGNSNQTWLIH